MIYSGQSLDHTVTEDGLETLGSNFLLITCCAIKGKGLICDELPCGAVGRAIVSVIVGLGGFAGRLFLFFSFLCFFTIFFSFWGVRLWVRFRFGIVASRG